MQRVAGGVAKGWSHVPWPRPEIGFVLLRHHLHAVRIHAEELIRIRELTSEILAKHTGQSMEQIELDVERDRYLSAAQAKEYGLIDEVIAHRE